LIGEHEEASLRTAQQLGRRIDEAETAFPQQPGNCRPFGLRRRWLVGIDEQAFGEVSDWIAARPERRNPPRRSR
jgi:hypothetical protein